MKSETRNFLIKELRSETNSETGKRILAGYAAVFNSRSELLGWFYEIIAPSAFTKTLQENRKIKALYNHDFGQVLGSIGSGTLRLSVDEIGLRAEVDLPDTTFANDLVESVSRGDIDGMSFMFDPVVDSWEYNQEKDETLRTLKEVRLYEVSFVSYPAYSSTTVGLRDLLSDDKIKELYQGKRDQLESTGAETSPSPNFGPSLAKSRFM